MLFMKRFTPLPRQQIPGLLNSEPPIGSQRLVSVYSVGSEQDKYLAMEVGRSIPFGRVVACRWFELEGDLI